MTASGASNPRTAMLSGRFLLLAVLLGLCGCGAMPAPARDSGQARAPGVYFHNDVVVTTGIGGGVGSR